MKIDLDAAAELIVAIERLGMESFPDNSDDPVREVEALNKLGLESGYLRDEPGGFIYLGTPGIRSWTGADHLNEVVSAHIEDNKDKTTDGPGERHLFVWIEFHSTPTWAQVTDGPLPDSPPPLDHVDVVWVAAQDSKSTHVWRADASGWGEVQ